MGKQRRNSLALLALLALVSCHEPLERESFLRSSERSPLGSYVFTLPLTDSLKTYDLSFFTRMTARDKDFASMPDTVRYHVVLKSPSEVYYKGGGFFMKDSYSDASSFSRAYVIPFRSGFKPVETGEWTLYLGITDEDVFAFDGFGTKLSKKE